MRNGKSGAKRLWTEAFLEGLAMEGSLSEHGEITPALTK